MIAVLDGTKQFDDRDQDILSAIKNLQEGDCEKFKRKLRSLVYRAELAKKHDSGKPMTKATCCHGFRSGF